MFKEKRRVGGWIDFQYWRDDICLVYGQTYARVRTSEVRCSINRPLLKSHINALTRAHTHIHRLLLEQIDIYLYLRRRRLTQKVREVFFST